LKVTQLTTLFHPLAVSFIAIFNTHNAVTQMALHTLILFLKISPHQVSTYHGATITLTATRVSTNTASILINFDEVVIFEGGMSTTRQTESTIKHVFVHLFIFAASETNVVIETVTTGI
jgi:hypothetical protein